MKKFILDLILKDDKEGDFMGGRRRGCGFDGFGCGFGGSGIIWIIILLCFCGFGGRGRC
ncbi:hypothetical protein [Clostridium aciditolerans]|uniref:Uncharacterized protein n=1 Tax=Clostridium aciditolerans TaxID=339861 RepID=A0A934I019_9CLOT|nr:hypothetical protein [Clostridium aciditolerans]MBI6872606.1 hypothetical protein [Clostridium aciditolerans]